MFWVLRECFLMGVRCGKTELFCPAAQVWMGSDILFIVLPLLKQHPLTFLCNVEEHGILLTGVEQCSGWVSAALLQINYSKLPGSSCAFYPPYITSLGSGSWCQNVGLQTCVINCRPLKGPQQISPHWLRWVHFCATHFSWYQQVFILALNWRQP